MSNLQPLQFGEGTFYRVHPEGRPFSPEDAQSKVHGYASLPEGRVKETVKPQTGYSSFSNPAHLQQYVREMRWDDATDEWGRPTVTDPVVRFRGRQVGRGYDNEPLVVPTSHVQEKMSWGDFTDRLEVTPVEHYPRWGES